MITLNHWGPNMVTRPSRIFQRFARAVIDRGADLYHGHSAHLFQGIEIYRGRPILYDTGEFLDDYAVDPILRNDWSFLFRVSLEAGALARIELLPVVLSMARVSRAAGEEREAILDRMQVLCAEMGTSLWRGEGHERFSLFVRVPGFVAGAGTVPYPEQEAAMEAALQGRDALVVLPTGFGKSLIYQVPAMILRRGGPAAVRQVRPVPRSATMEVMDLRTVRIDKPEAVNFILGQSHFIKTVEDLHEALVGAVPGIQFGVAFCESSGPALVRWSGTSPEMIELAKRNALAIGAGHCFLIFLGNAYPVNVLNTIKAVPEVCRIFCATANAAEVIVGQTDQGRAILGVVDGIAPRGVEGEAEVAQRKELLRRFGYKL